MAEMWTIQEWKFWKGLNKTGWARRGDFCFTEFKDAKETVEYLEHNDRQLILRVVPWYARDFNG